MSKPAVVIKLFTGMTSRLSGKCWTILCTMCRFCCEMSWYTDNN